MPAGHVVQHQVDSDVRQNVVDKAENDSSLLLEHGHGSHDAVHTQTKSNRDVVVECALPVVFQRVADRIVEEKGSSKHTNNQRLTTD